LPLPRILSAITLAAVSAGITLSIAGSLNRKLCLIFLLWFATLATYVDMEQNIYFIMAWCSLRMINANRWAMAILVLPLFLAYLSLIKFTFLLATVIALLICTMYLSLKDRTKIAAAISVSYLAALALLWKITGQELGDIGQWLRGSLEITSGYVEAMSSTPETVTLVLSFCTLFIFCFMLIFSAFKKILAPVECLPLLLLLLFAFLSWKLGFVRADEQHISRFFISFPLITGLILADTGKAGSPVSAGKPLLISFIAIMALSITVFHLQAKGRNFFKLAVLNFTASIETNSEQLMKIATGRYKECFTDFQTRSVTEGFPIIRSLVGDNSIDVISSISWIAMENRLNYRPRPVNQGNATYTPYLQNLNLSFLKSAHRPDWIVAKMDSIDDKLPVMEDALLFPWIIRNYNLKWSDNSTLLLKLKPFSPTTPSKELISERVISFGQPIVFSGNYDFPVILQVEVEPTFLGKLAGLLYHRPPLSMTLEFGKQKVTKRFVPSMAREGFLIQPLLFNVYDVKSYYRGDMRMVERIYFGIPANARLYYSDKIKIRISRAGL